MKEAVKDRRFKAWGSEYEQNMPEPVSKKRQVSIHLSKPKVVVFRWYLKCKEYIIRILN